MSDLEKVARLRKKLDTKRREADRAEGSLATLMTRLQEEFDCDSLKQAKKKLGELEASEKALAKKLKKTLAAFEEEWGDALA